MLSNADPLPSLSVNNIAHYQSRASFSFPSSYPVTVGTNHLALFYFFLHQMPVHARRYHPRHSHKLAPNVVKVHADVQEEILAIRAGGLFFQIS